MTPTTRIHIAIDATRATDADFGRASRIPTRRISAWRAMYRAEQEGRPYTGPYAAPAEVDAAHVERIAASMLRTSLARLESGRRVSVTMSADVADALRTALDGAEVAS